MFASCLLALDVSADRFVQGTYQFMSVNLLSNLANPVKIADELESFFHVLVYYAVRYLHSNCDEVDSFIQGYFHNYAGPQRLYGCGQKSVLMEVTGKLQTEIPYGPLLFDSPMDNLIMFTLECFRSRYKILEHASRLDVQPVPSTPPPPVVATPSPPAPTVPPPLTSASKSPLDDVDEDDVIDWDAPVKYDGPTPEDEARAQKITDHKFMLDIFSTALRQRLWAPNDRVAVPPSGGVAGGAVDATSDSERASTAPSHATSASTSSKRRRTAGPQAPATTKRAGSDSLNANRLVSLPPARLHASTRRVRTLVRSQARTMPIRARPQRVGCR